MADTSHPVYQLINGELVRKQGDFQDPGRRYSHVVSAATGETYIREYTDEEEQQADENADKWAAEEPIREAERQRQLEEAEKFRDSLIYENRVVFLTDKTWRQDSDGFRFYDFLQPFLAGHFADSSHEIQHASSILTNIRPKISAGIQQFSSRPKELMKYGWLVGYFNDVVDEYPETLVEKISL